VDLLVILIIIGWLTGRILGVRRGFLRAIFAGLVGLAAGEALISAQTGEAQSFDELDDLLIPGFLGYVLLVTMITSVVLEAILRPKGQRRSWRIPRPFRWLKGKFTLLQRLWEIALAARRHGLVGRRYASRAALSSPEGARALRLTLEDCGGMFVKFGQVAAGRDDILPPAVTHELGKLRTAVKPLPISGVQQVMAAELGAQYLDIFESFDETPLAAASIGVTHRARLKDGQRVIVKIQRPQIADAVQRDGRVLMWGARQLERSAEQARQLGIVDLAAELVGGLKEELDFTKEAANNAAMSRHRPVEGIRFPDVDRELTTQQVLVMEEVMGEPISDVKAVDATGEPREELADRLLKAFLDQILQDGVYHADPHPGNVLIDPAGELWFIDFGAVGFIDPITLEALQQLAIGFKLRDPGLLARSVRRMAGGKAELDIPALEYDMGQVLTQVEDAGFGPAAIGEVVLVLQRHGVRVPKSLTVLGRATVTMEGSLRTLAPGYDMANSAQTLVDTVPTAETVQETLKTEALRALPSLRPLPQLMEDLALQSRAGQLGIRVERYSGGDKGKIDEWLDRILWAAIAMVGLVGSAVLLLAAGVTEDEAVSLYLRWIGFMGLIVSSAMQMRVVARVLQRRKPDSHL
jgi:ubiquinone biosynthesis protein